MTATMVQMKSFQNLVSNFEVRLDPLEGNTKNRIRSVPTISAESTGKNVLARVLFSQRLYCLKLSLFRFSHLCAEDYRRQQIIKLAQDFDRYGDFDRYRATFFKLLQDYNELVPLSQTTISRLERVEGENGANTETLAFLAERLVNPITEDFFTQADMVNLYLGFESDNVNLELIDDISKRIISDKGRNTGEFVTLTRKLSRQKSEQLGYPLTYHSF